MPPSVGRKLRQAEAWIRLARFGEARSLLRELLYRRLPRRHRAPAARLARLCHQPDWSLRLLASVRTKATASERAEYGMALSLVGATHEALEVLSGLEHLNHPQVIEAVILAYFRRWDWNGALPFLEKLQRSGHSGADPLFAQYYLGRALLHGQGEVLKARRIFTSLAENADDARRPDLAYEARIALSDTFYVARDWAGACDLLDRLNPTHGPGARSDARLHRDMLRARSQLWLTHGSQEAHSKLRAVRHKLAVKGRWERVRQCDFHEAWAMGDQDLLLHLFFGTPYPVARALFERTLNELGAGPLPDTYRWRLGDPTREARDVPLLRLQTAPNVALAASGVARTLSALTHDFYASTTPALLHERAFGESRYDPTRSPPRVRKALSRLRLWIDEEGLPLKVVKGSKVLAGSLRLTASHPMDLEVPRLREPARTGSLLLKLREHFGNASFSAEALASVLDVSDRSARRYLAEPIQSGHCVKLGKGPSTRYRLSLPPTD